MSMKPNYLKYFSWNKMSKLIIKKFGDDAYYKYWFNFMVDSTYDGSNSRMDGIGHINLYHFGPRPKDCLTDASENVRIATLFNWTESNVKLFKEITHFIWDTLEDHLSENDIEMCHFKF